MTDVYFKRFGDDREHEVLRHILDNDPTITVPVVSITEEGFFSELYDQIPFNTAQIILQKINLLVRLHKIGVYHNDLGDHNFLIKDNQVRIIDFGSAFLTSDDEWLEVLFADILKNDGDIVTCKYHAFHLELTSFIQSFPV